MPVFICQGCGAEHQSWTGRCPECGTSETIRLAPNTDRMVDRIVKNKFRIVKKLGQGGMGAVYLAEQVGIGHKVALKFLKAEFSSDAEIARRFLNEAKSYARVAHPNAVALHDFGQDEEGNLFIAMEYCEGLDLKKLLAEKPLVMVEAIDVVLQVADVLANAHEKGVVHRDLKPENIMVRRGLRGLHAKVLDFGIARLMDAGTRLTVAGAIAGTPRYMSPEQVEGREVDLRADIYSLGIVLFELLTGRQPFDGSTIAEILRKQAVEPMPHLTEYSPELDYPDLDAVIQKACRKRREDRWPDMLAFANALSNATPTQQDLGLTPLQRSNFHRGTATPKPDLFPPSASGVAVPGQPVESSSAEHTSLKSFPGPSPFVPQEVSSDSGLRQTNLGAKSPWHGEAPPGAGATSEPSIELRPSRAPLIVAAAVVGLCAIGLGVYALRPEPAPIEPREIDHRVDPAMIPETERGAMAERGATTEPEKGKLDEPPSPGAAPGVATAEVVEQIHWAIVEGTTDSFYPQGSAQFEIANFEAAETLLKKVPPSSRYSAQASELLGKIKMIRETLAAAQAARSRGQLENAIRLYGEVLKLNPQVKAAREGLSGAKEGIINPIMQ